MSRSRRRGGSHNRSRNSNYKSRNRRSGGRGRRGGGYRHATFDPTKVVMKSKNQPAPEKQDQPEIKHDFADFNITDKLKRNIAERGFTQPTPIQDQTIPHILKGRDVVGIANTGTGKTAAFLIPLLNKVLHDQGQRTLIIAPTRELALQIKDELRTFTNGLKIYATVCIGGASIGRQIGALKRNPHFVIGTPGRIKDLNQRKKLHYDRFNSIVLDEVDRMLDMGFIHEIRAIIEKLPAERHSLFFSATMDDRVRQIMHGFLSDPITVSVKTQDTSANVIQDIVRLDGRSKTKVLDSLLRQEAFEKVLVFGRTKHSMNKLSRVLQDNGHRANAIHGNKSQSQRQRTLRQFREDKIDILVATDVVARGLDIDDITHVINYDLPSSYEDYIHRIGRTGRADKTGVALTFVE